MKLKWPFLAAAIIYTAVVIYYSLVLEEEVEAVPLVGEAFKIKGGFYVHLLAYLGMAILWRGAGYKMSTCFILAVAIGGSLEFAQLFLPFRSASMMDFFANSLGGFVGAVVVPLMGKKFYPMTG